MNGISRGFPRQGACITLLRMFAVAARPVCAIRAPRAAATVRPNLALLALLLLP